jgi:hypothetical protein
MGDINPQKPSNICYIQVGRRIDLSISLIDVVCDLALLYCNDETDYKKKNITFYA